MWLRMHTMESFKTRRLLSSSASMLRSRAEWLRNIFSDFTFKIKRAEFFILRRLNEQQYYGADQASGIFLFCVA